MLWKRSVFKGCEFPRVLYISKEVKLHYNNVATWRTRFLQALPTLQEIEAVSPEKLEEEIRILLSDKKRPGARVLLRRKSMKSVGFIGKHKHGEDPESMLFL